MFSMCHHDVPWYFTKFYHQTCSFCNRAESVFTEQSKFLDASIGLDESIIFHYGLPGVVSLLCVLEPKNLKYAKVGCFWCSLAQADPRAQLELMRTKDCIIARLVGPSPLLQAPQARFFFFKL